MSDEHRSREPLGPDSAAPFELPERDELDDRGGVEERQGSPETEADGSRSPASGGVDAEGSPAVDGRQVVGDQIHVEMAADGTEHSVIQNIGIQNVEYSKYYQWISSVVGDGGVPRRDLRRDDFEAWPVDRLAGVEGSFVWDEEQVACAMERLGRSRVLLLVGERGLGKGSLALVLAARLALREGLREALRSSRLDHEVRLPLEGLLDERGPNTACVLLFEDFYDDGNADLGRAVASLDEPRLASLTARLEGVGSYLILTSDRETLPGRLDHLRTLGIVAEVSAPSAAELLAALRKRVSARRSDLDRQGPDLPDRVEAVLAEQGESIAARIGTIPRAIRFVDELLVPVALAELDLDQALERLDDVEHWLLDELPADLSLWSFTLALTLASAHSRARWVSWSALHGLWRLIESLLERELSPGENGGARPVRRLIVDRAFLSDARAEVRRLPFPLGQAVRFCDPRTTERLWRVLMGPGRALLTTFAPEVRRLAASGDRAQREVSARCLGRMGELQPRTMILPHLDRWSRSGTVEEFFGMGQMMMGALASEDREYVEGCLDRLRRVVEDVRSDEPNRALMALVPLGSAAGPWVLDTLRGLLDRWVGRRERKASPVAVRMGRVVDEIFEGKKDLDRVPEAVLEPVALAALAGKDARAVRVLDGVQFVLVGLCFGGAQGLVLEHLAGWLGGAAGPAPWIAFVALRKRGMLKILEEHPVPVPADGHESHGGRRRTRCSQTLLILEEERTRETLARFLEGIYIACEPFPGRLRVQLRQRLVKLLRDWARKAASVSSLRPGMIEVLALLLDSDDEALRHEVFNLLRHDPKMNRQGSKQEALAVEALRASVPGSAGSGRADE